MKRLFILLLAQVLSFVLVAAQERTVTGVVTDAKDGSPLPLANVQVKGTSNGTVTGSDGRFSLRVPGAESILVFFYTGYRTIEIPVGNQTTFEVSLKESQEEIDQVVVVGYGTARKTGSTVGSIASVGSDVLETRPVSNPLEALGGRVAGMSVLSGSGEPSSTASITIHGNGSLTASSAPLYILDGVPVSSGTILAMNPNDFAQVDVLKDASATSIYGSRAANGVIAITTKRGKAGERGNVTVRFSYGWSSLANMEYYRRRMSSEQLLSFRRELGHLSEAEVAQIKKDHGDTDFDWVNYYYRPKAPLHQGDITFSGASKSVNYYISSGYMNSLGLRANSRYDKYNLRTNVNARVVNWLRIGINSALSYDISNQNDYKGNAREARPQSMLPWYTPYDAEGNEGEKYTYLGRDVPTLKTEREKYWNDSKTVALTGSAYIEIEPISHLTLRSQVGVDGGVSYEDYGSLPSHFLNVKSGGYRYNGTNRYMTVNVTNTIEYKWLLKDKHSIIPLLGHEYVRYGGENYYAQGNKLTDDRLLLLGEAPADKRKIGSGAAAYWFNSYFGRLEYNYADRYFLDLSIRNDASSRFGAKHRNALFWSAGAMWKAKNERFLQEVSWLNELTPRVSVGTSGNASVGNYTHLATVGTITNYDDHPTYGVGNSGNEELTWEKQLKLTAGVKVGFFHMVSLDVSFYRRLTTSMLMDVPTPYYLGISTIKSNVGALSNTGMDVALQVTPWRDREKGDYVSLYANYNYNKDRVESLWSGRKYWIMPNYKTAYAVGGPVQYYMPLFYRINPDNGNPEWYLPNEENPAVMTADPSRVATTADGSPKDAWFQAVGKDRYPHHVGGFGLSASYFGFYMQADFNFVVGKWMVSNDIYFFNNPVKFSTSNLSKELIDNYWTPDRRDARYPRPGLQVWSPFDSRMLSDASFLRMKNFTFGYSVPQRWLERTKYLSSVKVYCMLRNFLTVTKFDGPDPEPNKNLTYGGNPATRQVMVGCEVMLF